MSDCGQIEITPEAIEAGVSVLQDSGLLTPEADGRVDVLRVLVREMLVSISNCLYTPPGGR
jgi:hypothetical protein